MTIIEYIKLAHRNLFIIICCTLFCSATGLIYANNLNTNLYDNQFFISIGIQDKQKSTDSYANLQAADQITESIQGWLKDPALQQSIQQQSNLNYQFNAKKQEKNNLIISFTSSNKNSASLFIETIISNLKQRTDAYNQNSDITILLNPQHLFTSPKTSPKNIYIILATLIGLFLGFIFAFIYEEITGKIKSIQQFTTISGISNYFHFNNNKDLQKNPQYLSRYLHQKYSNQKLQILDLTHKTKIGLETISKHGNFQEIKSWNIPSDLDNVQTELPTLILIELGYTSTSNLLNIKKLGFSQLEAVIFNYIKK